METAVKCGIGFVLIGFLLSFALYVVSFAWDYDDGVRKALELDKSGYELVLGGDALSESDKTEIIEHSLAYRVTIDDYNKKCVFEYVPSGRSYMLPIFLFR